MHFSANVATGTITLLKKTRLEWEWMQFLLSTVHQRQNLKSQRLRLSRSRSRLHQKCSMSLFPLLSSKISSKLSLCNTKWSINVSFTWCTEACSWSDILSILRWYSWQTKAMCLQASTRVCSTMTSSRLPKILLCNTSTCSSKTLLDLPSLTDLKTLSSTFQPIWMTSQVVQVLLRLIWAQT